MDKRISLLLIEDEPHIAEALIYNLTEEGYRVCHAESGEEGLKQLAHDSFALLILDLMLPGIDGLEVCRQLREQGNDMPILMLTARSDADDRIAGLSTGADDYLPKPFNLQEFLLRVAALLRRANLTTGNGSYRFGNNCIDMEKHLARTEQGELELTELEIKMLKVFFAHNDKVLSRSELLHQVWGMAPGTETRTLDNFIVRLRKYFEKDPANPKHFRTVRGRGYRFVREP